MQKVAFDWSNEIHQVVTKSLVTTFGLDFLLLEDKKGGDVDTIHNVRQGIYATEQEQQKYEQREQYNSAEYHQHQNYKQQGRTDKILHQDGQLYDAYRGTTMAAGEKRDLDHVISAKEIHEDRGRILAELSGVDLANQEKNLQSTTASINRSKQDKSINTFIEKIPESIQSRIERIGALYAQLESMPQNTPQQKHAYKELEAKIENAEKSLKEFQEIDPEKMKEVDQQARENYDAQINKAYYTSSKFFGQTAQAALNNGFQMGARQAIGLVFAEIWFELKDQIPYLMKKYKAVKFEIKSFFNDLKESVINIFERVKLRFKNLVAAFKEGMLSGILSSVMTTIINIFLSTTKFWGRIIRETWLQVVQIVKLVFFNPENLSTSDLVKATFKLLSISAGTITGILIQTNLTSFNAIPFGTEISIFISALASGFVILGLNYFIETSSIMNKLWDYLDSCKSKYENVLDSFKEINIELDRFLLELTQLEFGINVQEFSQFACDLQKINDEMERNILLKAQIEKQNIKLPFEMGNADSTKDWLLGLCDK